MLSSPRLLLLPLALGLGCVALNPAYQDTESGGGSSSASSTSGEPTTGFSGSASSDSAGTTMGTSDTDVSPTAVEFFDETWDGQFGAGEHTDSFQWNADIPALQLIDGTAAGRFESRIFDAGQETSWELLQWGPRAAYGVPLRPASDWQADEYSEGSIGDADLSLLLHFEDGPWDPGSMVRDVSDGEFDGVWSGRGSAAQLAGVFGLGLENLDEGGGDFILFADGDYPEEGPLTWTLWFRTTTCVDNQTMIALDSPAVNAPGATGTAFIGCDFLGECTGAANRRYAYVGIQGAGGSPARACSSAPIDDGQWHFLAMRRRVGNGTQAVDVFVDGEAPVSSPDALGITDVSIHPGPDAETFTVAGGNQEVVKGATIYPGRGEYDQVALWNRQLTIEELRALYERGVQRYRMQVRACAAPDCSDQPFVGPGANPGRNFLDPGPDAEHTIDISGLGLSGRYFQYSIEMLRPIGVSSPATTFVRVVGHHP